MRRRSLFIAAGLTTVLGILLWHVREVRAFTITGPSEAPSLLYGDRVVVDLSDRTPRRGALMLFRVPNRGGVPGVKRVVGIAGDVVHLDDNNLRLNGVVMRYVRTNAVEARARSAINDLGSQVLEESGPDMRQMITFTPGRSERKTYGPITVTPGHVLLLGDNRDNSNDARFFGLLPEGELLGTVVMRLPSVFSK